MDLKNRFLSLGIEEAVVNKLLPVITPDEAGKFYDLSDSNLRERIPELLERAVDSSLNQNDLDLEKIGLKNIDGSEIETILKQQPELTPPIPKTSQSILISKAPKNQFGGCLYSMIGFIALIMGFVIVFNGLKKNENPELSKKIEEVKKQPELIEKKVFPPKTLIPVEVDLPKPPDFRASWMFMPWDNYKPEIICRDGRFKSISDTYTIQFWLKLTQKIPLETGIIELFSGKKPIESIFLNEDGYLCFNPGNEYKNLVLYKSLPNTGQHFHIAAIRDKKNCKLFVNGKLRQDSIIEFDENSSDREFMILFRSKSTLKGLAIDELMISNEVLYYKNFKPNRILTPSESTVLYIPFEKADSGRLRCYGSKKYSEFLPNGGKWLNVLNEVQQVINHIEFSEESKVPKSSSSEP